MSARSTSEAVQRAREQAATGNGERDELLDGHTAEVGEHHDTAAANSSGRLSQ